MWNLGLEDMLAGNYEVNGAYDWVGTVYAQGWLLTHYLSYNLDRRGQLSKYINSLQEGVPAHEAAKTAFGDIKELEKELNEYLKRDSFTVSTIPANRLHISPIEVRPLRPGEAAMMDDKIRLSRGHQHAYAGRLAGSMASIVERYGDDPAVLTTAAEVDILDERFDRAATNAAKAVTLDPKNVSALLALGEAKMALAKQIGPAADWDAVRAIFAKANHIDPENAAPLVEFYKSYVGQGIAPTPNAIEGLRYAVVLAPSDIKLRLVLVEQFIKDGTFDDAEATLATLAYDPDSQKWQKIFLAVLDPVKKSDQIDALAALQTAQKMLAKETD